MLGLQANPLLSDYRSDHNAEDRVGLKAWKHFITRSHDENYCTAVVCGRIRAGERISGMLRARHRQNSSLPAACRKAKIFGGSK